MKIEDCTPGRGVVYRPAHGAAEDGEIVRVNDSGSLVFVRYRGHTSPMATRPEDLEPLSAGGGQ